MGFFMIKFNHFNFNVLDLNKSLAFYKEALGLEPVRKKVPMESRREVYTVSISLRSRK